MALLRDYAVVSLRDEVLKFSHEATFYDTLMVRDTQLENAFSGWTRVVQAWAKTDTFNSKQDWSISVGLCLKTISDTTNPISQRKQCLQALSSLCSKTPVEKYLSSEEVMEIISLLNHLKSDNDSSFKAAVMPLLVKFITNLDVEVIKNDTELKKLLISIIDIETSSSTGSSDNSRYVVEFINSIISIVSLSDDKVSQILCWLLNELDKKQTPQDIQLIVTSIMSILKDKTETLKISSIYTVIQRLSSQKDISETTYQSLVLAMMRILGTLSSSDFQIHVDIIKQLSNIFSTAPLSVRMITITLFRTYIETLHTQSNTDSKQILGGYLHDVVPGIVTHLYEVSKLPQSSITPQILQLAMEEVKFLVILHNISVATSSTGVLAIIVPTLLCFLNNDSNASSLHTTALQIILGFAQTQKEECALVIEQLPDREKQILQIAVQLNYMKEQAKLQKETSSTSKLTIDISKFN